LRAAENQKALAHPQMKEKKKNLLRRGRILPTERKGELNAVLWGRERGRGRLSHCGGPMGAAEKRGSV